MEQAVFFDLEVRWEGMFMPAEKDAGGDRLDIHRWRFQDPAVFGRVLDYFLVEHLVLAPAGDGIKFVEMVGE